jgi:hypothetical protein
MVMLKSISILAFFCAGVLNLQWWRSGMLLFSEIVAPGSLVFLLCRLRSLWPVIWVWWSSCALLRISVILGYFLIFVLIVYTPGTWCFVDSMLDWITPVAISWIRWTLSSCPFCVGSLSCALVYSCCTIKIKNVVWLSICKVPLSTFLLYLWSFYSQKYEYLLQPNILQYMEFRWLI